MESELLELDLDPKLYGNAWSGSYILQLWPAVAWCFITVLNFIYTVQNLMKYGMLFIKWVPGWSRFLTRKQPRSGQEITTGIKENTCTILLPVLWIYIGSMRISGSSIGSIRIQGFPVLLTKNCKILQLTKKILLLFGSRIAIVFISRPLWRASCTRSQQPLNREHPAFQNMKFLRFFLFLRVIFALLNSDPAYQNQCGSGSTTLIASLSL